jgi:hypothetical protein
MSDDPSKTPAEFSARGVLGDIKAIACREPAKAIAAAFGVGLLLNFIPARVLVGTVTVVGATLMRPALLSLGVIKAAELCCQNHQIPLHS